MSDVLQWHDVCELGGHSQRDECLHPLIWLLAELRALPPVIDRHTFSLSQGREVVTKIDVIGSCTECTANLTVDVPVKLGGANGESVWDEGPDEEVKGSLEFVIAHSFQCLFGDITKQGF